jgi:hypothetical protein
MDAPLRKLVLFATGETDFSATEVELKQMFPDSEVTIVCPSQISQLLSSPTDDCVDWQAAISWLRQHQFNASVILNGPDQSPYALGYLCYLAGIPIRLGYSHEFGGQVLTHDLYAFGKESKRGREEESKRGSEPVRVINFLCKDQQAVQTSFLQAL